MTTTEPQRPTDRAELHRAAQLLQRLRRSRPRTRRDLRNYLRVFLGLEIPDKRICPEHNSPMDYLWHCFQSDFRSPPPANADVIVWANRAGGKTQLAAVATLLDCIFKPGCQVRILAGSGDQAGRMYHYLCNFLQKGYEPFLAGPIRKRQCRFRNGSTVEVLTQSPASVRGQHVHKLRCDELELFDADVFAAAKFTTHSTGSITAAMECISTMHRPYGLMQKLVTAAPQAGTTLFKWCLWEVIEKCTDRNCSQCPLWPDCGGKAKHSAGYLKIDDCITQMRRSSRPGWEAEMLCIKPALDNVVFSEFDPAVHVQQIDYDPNLPLYRALDFGFVNPFVCLWLQVTADGTVRVIDEYLRSRATIDAHAAEIKARTPCPEENVAATFCDPAGSSRNDLTGTSPVQQLRLHGIVTRYRPSSILEGIELIRRALRDGSGKSSLLISPRCTRLIEAMQCYHYAEPGQGQPTELPVKDGIYDHPIDALRYFFVNYRHNPKTSTRRY